MKKTNCFENKGKTLKSNSKGVTLITLVITIIILIILASISISLLLGDNGFLKKVRDGRDQYEAAKIHEQINLAYHSALAKGLGKVDETLLEEAFDNEFGTRNTDYILIDSEDGKSWVITRNGVSQTIPKPI